MGWGKEVEQQRSKAAPRLDAARQKAAAAAAAGNAHSKSKLVKVLPNKAERKGLSTLGVVGLAGALVGMRLCLRYKQQIREALRRLAKGGGGAHEGGVQGSSFRFPGAGRKAGAGVKADKGKSKSKAGAGTPVAGAARDATSSSLPRNKVSNNKKNKERKKDKKEAKEVKKMQAEIDADFEAKYGPTGKAGKANTTVVATNQVPADDDMVGGAAGKTFTTHQTMKVSTGYAKIRETVGKD